MAAYFTGGGAGTDVVQAAGTDGLQTLYFMNPSYVGFTDAAAVPGGGAAANMVFLNSAVSTLTPASLGHHQPTPAAQHFVGIPLQPAPQSGYNLWGPDTTAATGNDASPRHGQKKAPAAGTSAAELSPVLSLSSREAPPPVTVAASVPGGTDQEQAVMRSRYLKAAQELLDEAVSVSKGVEEAKGSTAVKKKEDSEGGVSGGGGGGAEDGGGSKSGGGADMSTAERQELQMKKSKLLNMLDEVEQRYRQYHRQMQAVAAAFEAAAGAGSARTYTSLALRTISRQFRCLRDAIAAQVRAASRGLGEDCGDEDGGGGGGGGGRTTVGSRLRFIDHQLRQQRAMQQLGMVHGGGVGGGGGGWRPQRGLPERAVSVLRAWLFEHFLHPYPKDSDKVMLAKQTGLTRSQVSNWFINARVRLWKPMVEEMYAEETKAKEEEHDAAAAGRDRGGGGSNSTGDSVAEQAPDKPDGAGIGMSPSPPAARTTKSRADVHASSSLLEIAGDRQAQVSFYGGGGDGDDPFQCRIKKAKTMADQPAAAFHVSDEAASHRELLMKFMEAGGEGVRSDHPDVIDDDDVAGGAGGYSLFTPVPYGHQFGSDHFAFAGHGGGGGGGGGVSLTLGLPHGADQTPPSFIMGASAGSDGGTPVTTAGYDMNMQSTKSLAAQLMRDFVA